MADPSVVVDDIEIPGIDRKTLPEHVALRTPQGSIVILIGTAHISEQSAADVATLIQTVKPKRVLVELCPARASLIDPVHVDELYTKWKEEQAALAGAAVSTDGVVPNTLNEVSQTTDHGATQRGGGTEGRAEASSSNSSTETSTPPVLGADNSTLQKKGQETEGDVKHKPEEKEGGTLRMLKSALSKQGGILAVAISYMYDSISSQVKLHVGDDMRTAAEEGAKVGARIVLGDRPIGITIARTWGGLSTWQKMKLGYELLKVSFSSIKAEDLEMLKNKDILTSLVQELSVNYPSLCTHLLHERDLYMITKLRLLPGPVSVGVVGLGHVEGIKRHWNDEIDVASLMVQPPSSSWKWFFFKLFLICGTPMVLFFAFLFYILR